MKRYPIGIQDFSVLREGDYLYIDKTGHTHELAQSGKYFFLSRPRRFGKSLLLSTLKYYFLGRRDLFEGLWVDREAGYDWKEHPVLHFSFSSSGYKDIGLERALLRLIDEGARQYDISLRQEGLSGRFRELIQGLGGGAQKLVLLIDEYDKPLVDYLDDLPQAKANRDTMKTFFSVIKDCDPYLQFFLITGVSKFSKVSLFSDLNHLKDLTLHPRYASLTGYTQEEIEQAFSIDIQAIALKRNQSVTEVFAKLKNKHLGYSLDGQTRIYTPDAVNRFFESDQMPSGWFEFTTPSFLAHRLPAILHELTDTWQYDLDHLAVSLSSLESDHWQGLFFQAGYLTLKSISKDGLEVVLGYPHNDAKAHLLPLLLHTFAKCKRHDAHQVGVNTFRALDAADLPRLMELIDTLFSTIPYQIFEAKREGFFHAVLHLTFQGLGLLTQSEVSTAQGRVDTIVHSKSGIYVMEFKLDAPAAEALNQIREKRYGTPYLDGSQPVTAVGISFSSKTKTVAGWEAMPYRELLAQG